MTNSAPSSPVLAIVGKSAFLRGEALRGALIETASYDDVGTVRMDGSNAALADVLDEVRMPSLFGDRRTVIVDNADSFVSAHRAALERYTGDPALDGSLILMCDSMPKNTKLYKAIQKTGTVLHCDPPRGNAIVNWAINRATRPHGKRLTPPAANRLRERTGDDPGLLDSEIAKLAAYVGERGDITPEDVDALSGRIREEKVFGIIDAMAEGNVAGALSLWEQVLASDRSAFARAVAGLAWGVRRLLEARRDWDDGEDVGQLARRLFTQPLVARRRLERWSESELERQLTELLEIDVAVKTGASTVETGVAKFIVRNSMLRRVQDGRRGVKHGKPEP